MLYFPNDVHYLEKIKGVRFKEICMFFNLRFAAKVEHKIAALSKYRVWCGRLLHDQNNRAKQGFVF